MFYNFSMPFNPICLPLPSCRRLELGAFSSASTSEISIGYIVSHSLKSNKIGLFPEMADIILANKAFVINPLN